MPKFRLKPGEIEAVQFDGENWVECISFTGTRKDAEGKTVPVFTPLEFNLFAFMRPELSGSGATLWLNDIDGIGYVKPGDWIIKGKRIHTDKNGYHLMQNNEFELLFDRIED